MITLPKNKKTCVGALVIAVLTNYLIPPIAGVNEMLRVLYYGPSPIQITSDSIEQKVLAQNASVLDYLNAATEIVGVVYDPENNIRCAEYGRAIFEAYQKLVVVNGRNDFVDRIRVCADMKKNDGHLWIEYKDGDNVLPYQFYPGSEEGLVGVRTVWGSKLPYPTGNSLARFGGLVGVLMSEK